MCLLETKAWEYKTASGKHTNYKAILKDTYNYISMTDPSIFY